MGHQNFKYINIGNLIQQHVKEQEIKSSRICNFLKCEEEEIAKMYEKKSLDTEILLKWSKLLEYDFFRLYTQHLILYAPTHTSPVPIKKSLPVFRKNIYTKEIKDFILELLDNKEKTKQQIIDEYRIPKTTLYKWIAKQSDGIQL